MKNHPQCHHFYGWYRPSSIFPRFPRMCLFFLACFFTFLTKKKKLKRCYIMVPLFWLVWLYFIPVIVLHFWWDVLKKKHWHMSSIIDSFGKLLFCHVFYFSSQMPCYTFVRSNHFNIRKWLAYAGILCLRASLVNQVRFYHIIPISV